MADEEEIVEDEGAAPAGAEFVPERSVKPRSDVYTLVLVLTFCAFLAGCILAGREAWEHYDVQFFMFNKDNKKMEQPAATPAPASAPVDSGTPAAQPEAPKEAPKDAPKEPPK